MNEKLQEALVNTIMKATESAEQAGEFLLAELPDIVQQLLMWKICEASIFAIVPWIIFIVIVLANKYFWKRLDHTKDCSGEWKCQKTVYTIAISILLTINIMFLLNSIFVNVFTIIQIYIAPKIYLIEYASDLIK